MAKSVELFSLVGEICLDGRPVLPSLLVKLKYVNDLLAEGECALGQGRSELYSLVAGMGGSLSSYSGRGYYCILYYSVLMFSISLFTLTALDLLCMNKPIYSLCRGKNLINLVIDFSFYVNAFFTHSKIVTNNFLEPSESLIYFLLKLLKSFKVFLKQNINTFYSND